MINRRSDFQSPKQAVPYFKPKVGLSESKPKVGPKATISNILPEESDSEDEISFQSIVRDKPKAEVVCEFLQEYINKLVNDDSDNDSDYMESSEYNTDR